MEIYNDQLILFSLFFHFALIVCIFFLSIWLRSSVLALSLNNKQRQVEFYIHSVCHIIFMWKSIIPNMMPHEKRMVTKEAMSWCVSVHGAKVNTRYKTKQLKLSFGNIDAQRWKPFGSYSIHFDKYRKREREIQICRKIPTITHIIERCYVVLCVITYYFWKMDIPKYYRCLHISISFWIFSIISLVGYFVLSTTFSIPFKYLPTIYVYK